MAVPKVGTDQLRIAQFSRRFRCDSLFSLSSAKLHLELYSEFRKLLKCAGSHEAVATDKKTSRCLFSISLTQSHLPPPEFHEQHSHRCGNRTKDEAGRAKQNKTAND
jgi:hypothetical protein